MSNKTFTYVDEQIFNTRSTPGVRIRPRSKKYGVKDKFREALGSYFEVGTAPPAPGQPVSPDTSLVFKDYRLNPNKKFDITFTDPVLTGESIVIDDTLDVFGLPVYGEDASPPPEEVESLPSRTVKMTVNGGPVGENFDNPDEFQNYINGIIDTSVEFFEDNHFKVTKPLNKDERLAIVDTDTAPTSDISVEYRYGFYNQFYESVVQNPRRPETRIENAYNYIYDPALDTTPSRDPYSMMDPRSYDKKITLLQRGKDVFRKTKNITIPRSEAVNYKNVYIPYGHTKEINEYSSLSNAWPMSINVRMKLDQSSELPEMLKKSEVADLLLRQVGDAPYDASETSPRFTVEGQSYDGAGNLSRSISTEKVKQINILRWFENALRTDLLQADLPRGYTFLGDPTDGTITARGLNPLSEYEGLLSFILQLESVADMKSRTYHEVLLGEEPVSEVVAYRIAKFDASRPRSQPIQNFFLFNTNEDFDVMDFVDTQVKYAKKYRYVIYAYRAVYGSAYDYRNIRFTPGNDEVLEAEVDVVIRPTLRMYEIPMHESIGQIIENPPVPPMIDVLPYYGVGDRLKFHMNGGTGLVTTDPILLLDSDKKYFDDYRETYDLLPNDPITFKNDDSVSAFQIFRVGKPPLDYEDFRDKLHVTVSTDIDPRSPLGASSAAYIEHLKPNRKYYYIFRSLDVHGQPSLPSPVYRIEMIDDGATIFPIIEAFDFPTGEQLEARKKMPTRSFKKLFYIAPKFWHSYVNEEKGGFQNAPSALGEGPNIYLGGRDESVWGRRFKVRFISKSTGKKIDFNFDVDHKHIETEKERN